MPASAETLSPPAARRIALAAQGFGTPPPTAVGTRQLTRALQRLGVLQIDSVNVFERSHYLPLFARLGSYDKALLDRLTLAPKAPYLEAWAHVAAFIPRTDWPLFEFRRAHHRQRYSAATTPWIAENGPMLDWLRTELAEKGSITASAIEHDANTRRGPWWGWSDVKLGLEYLFFWGEVVSAGRQGFERRYALAERMIPDALLSTPVAPAEAHRELIRRAARASGVGTVADLADYFRLKNAEATPAVRDLVDAGELIPVSVPGWRDTAYLWHEARRPRRLDAEALLSPFDPVVWFRPRAERLFDFHYRIEIYTPEPQRVFGYYSLPILLGERVVGRIDLKAHRKEGVLAVQSAWTEPHAPAETAERVAALVRSAAAWQGLDDGVRVRDRGDLARPLAQALGTTLEEG